ncbi:hypothetical protein BCR36DRAFT_282843 [Piromyces finnis]|uniref:NodB homology domain-containing protein n=1 Tax=Piromyces finnis TaxID=1754191 RepID=A0A1Y1VEX2_9FUNG|nr:hypothetical protein BCR36DRAFT_282843 [Piromyces finnis]|eukprot:ORX54664.1 hypothetical protein BCR36DRAFT_282843 [Piromyces finnis]
MHKLTKTSDKRNKYENESPKYQLYNYDSLEWSWAHITIIITLGLLFLVNIFGDVLVNNDNPYIELSYREKRSISRNKKYSKRDIIEQIVECEKESCLLPSCQCATKETPKLIPYDKLPQFVLISFDGSITKNTYSIRNKIRNMMKKKLYDIPFTYFITGDETDYYYVEKLYYDNDEISIHTYDTYLNGDVPRDIQSLKSALNNLSNIPMDELKGFRSPQNLIHKNIFTNLLDLNISYDSSLELPLDKGYWPFTLDYGISFINNTDIKGESFPGLWEIPLLSIPNAQYKRSQGTKNKGLLSSENNINIIKKEFLKNYKNKKLPFYLYFTDNSIISQKSFLHFYKEISNYISELSEINNDIYFITYDQLVKWMKNPIDIDQINLLNESKISNIKFNLTESNFKKQVPCSNPNNCKYSSTVYIILILNK